jgi:hypothetical protein
LLLRDLRDFAAGVVARESAECEMANPSSRASSSGFLNLSRTKYLELLMQTSRRGSAG